MADTSFLEKANRLVETQKYFMRLLYQLAFILTSDSPASSEAKKLIEAMKERGLVTDVQIMKAIEDVKRFRERVLDRIINQ